MQIFTIKDKSDPASRYRGYLLSKELNRLGMSSKVNPIGSKKYFLNILNLFLKLFDSKDDLYYVQRLRNPLISFLLKLHHIKGVKIIYDFDDAIFIYDNKEVNKMIKLSNAVIVGNNYLANYTKKYNRNVYVIPTSIDLREIDNLRKDYSLNNPKIILGWIGSQWTLKYLEEIREPLENIAKRYPLELRIIGPENSMEKLKNFKNINIKVIPWKLETEWKELSKVDIGIMPLPDDEWTKGKCALKLLQYMSLEIPAIGSYVGANKEAISNGKNGFLPKDKKEWEKYLELLIKDKKLRMKLGKAGRKTVEEKYSLEKNVKKLAKIIRALEKRYLIFHPLIQQSPEEYEICYE
ncbi:MAG: glycosyltransferase family 4 protein [Nanobdellota archaeon]